MPTTPDRPGHPSPHAPAGPARAVIAVVALLVLAAALWAGFTSTADRDAGGAGSDDAAGPVASAGPTSDGSADAGSGPGSTPGGAASGAGSATDPTDPTGPVAGSEVLAPTPGEQDVIGPKPTYPRVSTPLPPSASARGSVVAGYPVEVVPVPAGVTVVSSSVAAQGDRLQIGLEASTDENADAVRAAFGAALAAVGFWPSDSPTADGSTATAYQRGDEGVVLTVQERSGGGTELSVAGTLVVAG